MCVCVLAVFLTSASMCVCPRSFSPVGVSDMEMVRYHVTSQTILTVGLDWKVSPPVHNYNSQNIDKLSSRIGVVEIVEVIHVIAKSSFFFFLSFSIYTIT